MALANKNNNNTYGDHSKHKWNGGEYYCAEHTSIYGLISQQYIRQNNKTLVGGLFENLKGFTHIQKKV